jgi:selenocysteine lyase/cysteine desulfurase
MRILTETLPADTLARARERFAALRAREFARLDLRGDTYVDYTGSGLPARSQVERHRALLDAELIGNPHSHNPASIRATELVEQARADVLRFFGVDATTQTVVFTANASAAAKLVAEAYGFAAGSRLVLLADNHNSINGIRRLAERAGADTTYLPLTGGLRMADDRLPAVGSRPSLFAYPAQSNFSGVRHPLELVERARSDGYAVLLDAAAYAPTSRLDLRAVPADFVCV